MGRKSLGFAIFIASALCACGGEKRELIDMSTIESRDLTAIVWEGRTYEPFRVISQSDWGTQIGYLNGDADDRVCEYGDYPSLEWIANYLIVNGGALLYKEINVFNIPDGLTEKEAQELGERVFHSPDFLITYFEGSACAIKCEDMVKAEEIAHSLKSSMMQ